MADRDPPKPSPRKPPAGLARGNSRRATAAAVLGSVAALGGAGSAVAQTTGHAPRPDQQRRQSRRAADALPAGERALLTQVFSTLSARAPTIARPILAAGVTDGTITQAQQDAFLARLASVKAAEGGSGPTAGAGPFAAPAEAPPAPDPAGRAVFQQALAAIRADLPLVALPLLALAVAAGSISEAQATRLRARFEQGPRLGFGLVMKNAQAAGATRLP